MALVKDVQDKARLTASTPFSSFGSDNEFEQVPKSLELLY